MGKLYFSAGTKPNGGFYEEGVQKNIPEDAVEVSPEEKVAILLELNIGDRVPVVSEVDGKKKIEFVDFEQVADVNTLARRYEQKIKRDLAEEERKGVTVNGVRFGGSVEERLATQELLNHAISAGLTVFPSWKDSDGVYHQNLPVSTVEAGVAQLAELRFLLLGDEATKVSGLRSAPDKATLISRGR